MALVSYSDSEGSGDEAPKRETSETSKVRSATSVGNFTLDKSTNKIKVNLSAHRDGTIDGSHEDEPAPKRPRVGAGAFSGFNSMLPAPKRDTLPKEAEKHQAAARRVFSLKTGAEASFSRESDTELRQLFADQQSDEGANISNNGISALTPKLPKPFFAKPPPPSSSNGTFTFKPLSVARNQKKKRAQPALPVPLQQAKLEPLTADADPVKADPVKQKVNLFMAEPEDRVAVMAEEEEAASETGDDVLDAEEGKGTLQPDVSPDMAMAADESQSLNSIATDLNLSAAERRRLFGRGGKDLSAINVVNFNTDAEYAANQQLIATGETIQHNPVRGIAPGKHSLRQLVSVAATQKEALEESFAQGRRNKKEAGSKYGW